jgi:hypothetical protein
MFPDLTSGLIVAATFATGLLAGASLDQSVKQLPARHRIGVEAYARYSQAADLANGVAFYATLGIAAAAFNLAAAISAGIQGLQGTPALAVYTGAVLAILHSLVTARAAPTNHSQRRVSDEAELARLFNRFTRLQTLRCALQVANFAVNLWALVACLSSP